MNGLITTTITICGGVALFLYGMKIMSESLQIAAGDRLRNILWKITSNKIVGILTGIGITGIIQSSSATTVMLVSFVNAGLINLQQSIGIILGANVGTTVTGWIVALLGFKVNIQSFSLPAIAIGFFLRFINNSKLKEQGSILLGFGILFLGFNFMSSAVHDLRNSEAVMTAMATYKADTLFSTIIVILTGSIITMMIQSSSATMAMTMTLAANGLIDFPTSCALILGENIGTTITAYLASIGASINAKRSARVHLLFNLFGVAWVVSIFHWIFLPFVDWIIPGSMFSNDQTIQSGKIAAHLAGFHTIFNLSNTLLFIPFTRFLAWAAIKMVPDREDPETEETFHLKYISTNLVSTPAININQARLEIKRMITIITEMYDKVMNIFMNPNIKMGNIVEEIQKKENTIDLLEKEISTFLIKVYQHHISEDQSHEISAMLHMVNELERIGDHCESLLRLTRRKYDSNLVFSEIANLEIKEISHKVREFLELLHQNISLSTNILPIANVIENRIDEMRKEMRKRHINRLNEGSCGVEHGLLFLDLLTSFEKIGDHSLNVAEGISGVRVF